MRTLLLITSLALSCAAHASAPDGRPVRNSFVNHRVRTVADLIAHVRRDAVVADRYERHFAMSRSSVLNYLGGLHRGRLAQAGAYTIYSVPKGGWLKMHVGRLKKGEPMFFDRAGRPALVVRCGNPVTLGPKKGRRAADRLALSEPEGARAIRPKDATLGELMDLVPERLEATVPTATALAVTSAVETIPTVGAGGVGSGLDWIGTLAFAPSLGRLPHWGFRNDSGPFTPKQPVPEPATWVALAGGIAAALRKRFRR